MLWDVVEDSLHEDIRKERLAKYEGKAGFLGELRDAVIPFRVGDRVSVTVGGKKYGNGTIEEISNEWDRGEGTKLYPAYRVVLDNGKWSWLNGVSLSRTLQKEES